MSSSDGKKRLVRSRSGLRFVHLEESDSSPFEMREPFWIPDSESPVCMKCQAKFDFLTRRHHCRRCGNVFCNRCCDRKVSLPRMCFIDPVRICNACSEVTNKENDFYNKQLKTLLNGATFILDDTLLSENHISFLCRLSPNHQAILFDGGNSWEHEPVPLITMSSVQILGTTGSPGLTQVTGAVLTYIIAGKEPQKLHISVSSVPNRKQSISWITALQKALKFVNPVTETSK